MRLVPVMIVFASLAFSNISAQNPFGDLTNAPRPDEFIHWDAESFTGWKTELVGSTPRRPRYSRYSIHLPLRTPSSRPAAT